MKWCLQILLQDNLINTCVRQLLVFETYLGGGNMKTFKISRNILIVGLLFFLLTSLLMSYLYLVEKNRNGNMTIYQNSPLTRTDGSPISKTIKIKCTKMLKKMH